MNRTVLRGDFPCLTGMLERDCMEPWFDSVIDATMQLLRVLATRLRSSRGLLALDVALTEIAENDPDGTRRLAAAVLTAYGMLSADPPVDTIAAAETHSDMVNVGVVSFNAAAILAADQWVDVLIAAMRLVHEFLPEADSASGRHYLFLVAADVWPFRKVLHDRSPY